MVRSLLYGLSDLLFPLNCILCQQHIHSRSLSERVCLDCLKGVELSHPPFCPKCFRSLKSPINHRLCHICQEFPPHFDFAWAACIYNPLMRHLIHQYKYHRKTYLRFTFLKIIKEFINLYHLDTQQFTYIIPIPLHPSRFRERTFNQAELLAQTLTQELSLPINTHALIRKLPSKSQYQMHLKERFTNIHNAFRIKRLNNIQGANILLVDDILTSGATASEATRTLKQAGAKTVGVLTLAIA